MNGSTRRHPCSMIPLGLLLASVASAEPPSGPPADGLACRLACDRTEYAPGETVELTAAVQNVGKDTRLLPAHAVCAHERFGRLARLCLVTPRGQKWLKQIPLPGPAHDAVGYQELQPTWSTSIGIESFRLLADPPGWELEPNPVGSARAGLSLRLQGQYRLWVEFESAPLREAPPQAWAGKVWSNEVSFTVRDVSGRLRLDDATSEQIALLDRFVESGGRDAADLQTALLRAENEGLALEVVEKLRAALESASEPVPAWWGSLHALVQERACDSVTRRLGIEGVFLTRLVELQLALLEREEQSAPAARWPAPDPQALLVYLNSERREGTLVFRAIAYAERHAKLPPASDAGESPVPAPRPLERRAGLTLAWDILLRSGRLHDGITLAQAEQILGPPTERRDDSVDWYANSPRHVNPKLWARLREDQLYDWTNSLR
ncbi:MAG TPA: hypothetical protein PKK06_05765 [Phycisphaerae bacterium]|nr:hypothetical protein [Phycisphaerae bacterium]HNU44297.1 hypothetical protein [Phycisphaerae bacterium]